MNERSFSPTPLNKRSLSDEIVFQIKEMIADGTMQAIAEKYGLQDVIVTDDFGTYDPDMDYSALTQENEENDYQAIIDAGKMVLGYTLFAPMAYNA